MSFAYFSLPQTQGPEILVPEPMAGRGWGTDRMRGVAVSGALARASERAITAAGRSDLRPARWTLDLFCPATMQPCTTTATVVRQGRRLCLVDATLEQDGKPVARAGALFLQVAEPPRGEVWSPQHRILPPPPELRPQSNEPRLYYSEDVGWTVSPADHQSRSRKQTWHRAVPVVRGEEPTAFQMVASVADVTNLVTNWGSAGLEFINADITLALSRLPTGKEVGLSALHRVEHDGIATGTAVVFDRLGPVGTSLVTAMANAEHAVDLTTRGFGAEPPPRGETRDDSRA
jgi:hypothetical protein